MRFTLAAEAGHMATRNPHDEPTQPHAWVSRLNSEYITRPCCAPRIAA